VLALPLAAAGLLNPVIAGAAMALSSVSVVSNALLLKRWRPKKEIVESRNTRSKPHIGQSVGQSAKLPTKH